MAECKICIKKDVCDRDVGHGYSVCPHYLSADVVEVVRCKDCKYFVSEICRHDLAMNLSRADDFCSYAKMKGVQ